MMRFTSADDEVEVEPLLQREVVEEHMVMRSFTENGVEPTEADLAHHSYDDETELLTGDRETSFSQQGLEGPSMDAALNAISPPPGRRPYEQSSNQSSSQQSSISQVLSATNAKRVALLLVLGFLIYHSSLHIHYGVDSCKWLLSNGRWQGYQIWQPYGCMMHTYSKSDARMCLRYIAYWGDRNTIAFVGDSRIRQLYIALLKLISSEPVKMNSLMNSTDLSHHDQDLRLDIDFHWHSTINAQMFQLYRSWMNKDVAQRPKIIVTGCVLSAIRAKNGSAEALEDFKANLTRLLPSLDDIGVSSHILWVLQDPVDEEKLSPEWRSLTNDFLVQFNWATTNIMKYSQIPNRVRAWGSPRLVSEGYSDMERDGIHAVERTLHWDLQILLNMYCNNQMNFNDGTCCADPEQLTFIQLMTGIFFIVCLLISAFLVIKSRYCSPMRYNFRPLVKNSDDDATDSDDGGRHKNPIASNRYELPSLESRTISSSHHEVLHLFTRAGLILGYIYLCDRTNFFLKENKYYTHSNFFLPITYIFALGLFFTEECATRQRSPPQWMSFFTKSGILNRDQTDEWKGWMQIILLTYHMTNASTKLPIYMHVRVLVSAYLFLTGFGHFTYFWYSQDSGTQKLLQKGFRSFPAYWKTKNNALRRFFQVQFRNNFSVICLCLVMNRPYQFYYFVPLVSFWYCILFFIMIMVPRVNATTSESNSVHYFYMVLKFISLLCLVAVLYMSEVLFEKLFLTRPWKALFVTTDDSIKEWWFRWKIDRYSVPAGMIFGFALHFLKSYQLVDMKNGNNLFPRYWSLFAAFIAFIGMGIYSAFAVLCRNKSECNEILPYVSFIPIVAFIFLRNIFACIRKRFSVLFAFFGRISLELFIFQYHILLAADTHGVLVLIPSYPVLNVIFSSFIFMCAAHEFHEITIRLVPYAVPSDWRLMARNLLTFILVLIPMGIKAGMF